MLVCLVPLSMSNLVGAILRALRKRIGSRIER
jgi:hypothetical protein